MSTSDDNPTVGNDSAHESGAEIVSLDSLGEWSGSDRARVQSLADDHGSEDDDLPRPPSLGRVRSVAPPNASKERDSTRTQKLAAPRHFPSSGSSGSRAPQPGSSPLPPAPSDGPQELVAELSKSKPAFDVHTGVPLNRAGRRTKRRSTEIQRVPPPEFIDPSAGGAPGPAPAFAAGQSPASDEPATRLDVAPIEVDEAAQPPASDFASPSFQVAPSTDGLAVPATSAVRPPGGDIAAAAPAVPSEDHRVASGAGPHVAPRRTMSRGVPIALGILLVSVIAIAVMLLVLLTGDDDAGDGDASEGGGETASAEPEDGADEPADDGSSADAGVDDGEQPDEPASAAAVPDGQSAGDGPEDVGADDPAADVPADAPATVGDHGIPPGLWAETHWWTRDVAAMRDTRETACDDGDTTACVELAWLREHGIDVDPDGKGALAAARKACEAGADAGCFIEARVNYEGNLVRRDAELAYQRFGELCERGFADACAYHAGMRQYGDGPAPREGKDAVAELETLCADGSGRACVHLGVRAFGGSDARGVELLEQACDAGSARGCYEYARLFHKAKVVEQDVERAEALYEVGCRAGHPSSCTRLCYTEGEIESCRVACNLGDGQGCWRLADLSSGRERRVLRREACDKGYEKACKR